MTLSFTDATSVHDRGHSDGEYRFEAEVLADYWIIAGPNGGFLAALAARAVLAAAAHEGAEGHRLGSLTLHFLRAPVAGPVELAVRVIRVGRRTGSVAVEMSQGGRIMLTGLCAMVRPVDGAITFDDASAPDWVTGPIPEPIAALGARDPVPMRSQFDSRPVLGGRFLALMSGRDSSEPGLAIAGGFIRPTVPTPFDECLAVALADAWWPPIFERNDRVDTAAPTLEYTVHLVHPIVPDSEFVAVKFESSSAAIGVTVEDGTLWARDGRQIARSRQIAILA